MDETPWYHKSYAEQFSARSNERVLPKIEAAMARQQHDNNSSRITNRIHPSDLAKNDWCPRATYYKMTGAPESDAESFSIRRLNTFAEGHSIHEKWQGWMHMTGCLVGTWLCNSCGEVWNAKSPIVCPECTSVHFQYREVVIFDDDHGIVGRADGLWEDTNGRAVIEIKSVGLGTIRWDAPQLYEGYANGELSLDELWKRIKRPLLPHRRQVNLYMHCLKIDKAIVIYEWKPTQEVKEFHLNYDPDMAKEMLDKAKLVNEAVLASKVPARPENARKGGMCKMCPFKTSCWG